MSNSFVLSSRLEYFLTDIITQGSVNGVITESKDGPFIFADGTPNPPSLLRDPPEQNYLSPSLNIFGFFLSLYF